MIFLGLCLNKFSLKAYQSYSKIFVFFFKCTWLVFKEANFNSISAISWHKQILWINFLIIKNFIFICWFKETILVLGINNTLLTIIDMNWKPGFYNNLYFKTCLNTTLKYPERCFKLLLWRIKFKTCLFIRKILVSWSFGWDKLRSHFSCPVRENSMWIEPLLRGHLSYKATFSLSQR
jgi:hypothetical protein